MYCNPLAFAQRGMDSLGPRPEEERGEFVDVIGELPCFPPASAVRDEQGGGWVEAGTGFLALSCRAGFRSGMASESPTAKWAFRNLDGVPPAGENPDCGIVCRG